MLMNDFRIHLSTLSCEEIKQVKKQIENETKKRQDKKIKEINSYYKEKELDIKQHFNEIAFKLCTTCPTDFNLSRKTRTKLLDVFVSMSRKYNPEYGYPYEEEVSNTVENDIIWIMSVLSQESNYNMILGLAQKIELNNLEYSRLSDISKVKESI